ncbi:MAG: IS4 family transposase [Acidobacteria bacterium]|nr:IS4 family transposase [Acidobacteriota bacterium]
MAYSKSVNLPHAAGAVFVHGIQLESRVERFERLLQCQKFVPLEVLTPIATTVLRQVSRSGKEPLMILMDRSMINDTANLLWVSVAYHGRALPLGWVEVPHEGNSDLALQQELLSWLDECLPANLEVVIVAHREFHSIHLAQWIEAELKLNYVLRIKAGTYIELDGNWVKAGELAVPGESAMFNQVRVTKDRKASQRVNLAAMWEVDEAEPWLLISNLSEPTKVRQNDEKRSWIEEMFSDHKSRGLNLEATRLVDSERLQRLLVAVTLAYLWLMQIGFQVVQKGWWRQVDNRGATRSVSLCQIGLRWLREQMNRGLLPPPFTACFKWLEVT